jgi:hypothetical protein
MRIKESLMIFEEKEAEMSLLVDRSECLLGYLVDENITIGGTDEVLSQSRFLWEKIMREAPQVGV